MKAAAKKAIRAAESGPSTKTANALTIFIGGNEVQMASATLGATPVPLPGAENRQLHYTHRVMCNSQGTILELSCESSPQCRRGPRHLRGWAIAFSDQCDRMFGQPTNGPLANHSWRPRFIRETRSSQQTQERTLPPPTEQSPVWRMRYFIWRASNWATTFPLASDNCRWRPVIFHFATSFKDFRNSFSVSMPSTHAIIVPAI